MSWKNKCKIFETSFKYKISVNLKVQRSAKSAILDSRSTFSIENKIKSNLPLSNVPQYVYSKTETG